MSLKDILKENPNLTVEGFQRFQEEYDRRFVAEKFTGLKKVIHTYAHVGKLLGRLAGYVEIVEEGNHHPSPDEIREKVIPDLLVYSVWLASEFKVNVEEAYLKRIVDNIRRLHSDKIAPEELKELEDYVNERFQKTD